MTQPSYISDINACAVTGSMNCYPLELIFFLKTRNYANVSPTPSPQAQFNILIQCVYKTSAASGSLGVSLPLPVFILVFGCVYVYLLF